MLRQQRWVGACSLSQVRLRRSFGERSPPEEMANLKRTIGFALDHGEAARLTLPLVYGFEHPLAHGCDATIDLLPARSQPRETSMSLQKIAR